MPKPSSPRAKGPGRPSHRAPAASRDDLLRSAAAVFAEHGYRGATVDEIVARAGLSKGTFYWNFASKAELFAALLDERLDEPVRAVMEFTASAPAETTTAGAVSQGLADLFVEQREAVLLLHEYWSAAVRDDELRGRYRERQANLRATLARALTARMERTGVTPDVPAEDLATAFVALAQGLSLDAVADPESIRPDLFGDILSLVYDGLVHRAEAR